MKSKTVKAVLLVALAVIALLLGFLNRHTDKSREKASKTLETQGTQGTSEKQKEQPKETGRQEIANLQNKADDNMDLPETKPGEITFSGYEENKEAFSWMTSQDWERLQKQLAGYLDKKGLKVTKANLHPDSIQKINDYERYVYMDVDYKTKESDALVIKVTCDTYKDAMRFAFAIQYGNEGREE